MNDLGYRRQGGMQILAHILRVDWPLLFLLALLCAIGVGVLWSASGEDSVMLSRQSVRLGAAFVAMLALARVSPEALRFWAPWLYGAGLAMLVAVLLVGVVGKGAQRWLDLGVFRFQPSELMKIAVPLMVARYLSEHPLPPSGKRTLVALGICLLPAILIAKQPDLGTAILISASGIAVMFLAGVSWWYICGGIALAVSIAPVLWLFFMHDYQRRRVMTLLDPSSDPLGAGYHIIQSKIAIGSGGLFGKGYLNGTQSHLRFLPERHTDFIFAVFGEEQGLVKVIPFLCLYLAIVLRCLFIASTSKMAFARLVAGSVGLTFFVYVFVNIGMVSGVLPVVGVPLPLVSYGGTSMVTLMLGFGILMSIANHKQLLSR